MNILSEILRKKNKNFEELSVEERAIFNRWESVLAGGKIDIEKLKEFLKTENERLIESLLGHDLLGNDKLDIFIKAQLRYGRLILGMIESPETSAKFLENHLKRIYHINE